MAHPAEFTDTDPRAMDAWIEILRSKTPGEKLLMALNAGEFAIRLSEAGVRARYPAASEREVFLRAASLRISRDLMIRAYGWDPDQHVDAC